MLKGGLFIYSLTEFDSRITVDVDFLLKRIPNTPEQLKRVVKEIISVETGNDFVTFEIKDVAPIAVAKKYAGIGVTLSGKIKIHEHHLVLILVWEMSLYLNRKSVEYRHS